MPQTPAKQAPATLPLWAIVLDTLGLLLLVPGLLMQFAPGSAVALALPAGARLPLLVLGGTMFLCGWAGMAMSIVARRRG